MGASVRTKIQTRPKVPSSTRIIQDSGAFCDGPGERLSFERALERQVVHAAKHGYASQITHRASYDLLIDEVWTDGNRHKRRWTVKDAETAVKATVEAAVFLATKRGGLSLILSAQGVDATQYLECVQEVAPLLDVDKDILGLGGWCIVGKLPAAMMPTFRETIRSIIPFAAGKGVRQVHIWGVLYAPALGELLWMCDRHNVKLSTDSAGPVARIAQGKWGYMGWTKKDYVRPNPQTRGLHMALHVQAVRCWLACLKNTKHYREPRVEEKRYTQLSLEDICN